MMALDPATLPRHELVGLHVEVVEATDSGLVGIAGEVVRETANTLGIEPSRNGRVRQVPKEAATFRFTLEDGQRVVVEGERLVARPAERTERRGDSTWR
jgi:ribonuclease P protein subunit POP4